MDICMYYNVGVKIRSPSLGARQAPRNFKCQNIENGIIFFTFLQQGPQIVMRAPKLLRPVARLAPKSKNLMFTPVCMCKLHLVPKLFQDPSTVDNKSINAYM